MGKKRNARSESIIIVEEAAASRNNQKKKKTLVPTSEDQRNEPRREKGFLREQTRPREIRTEARDLPASTKEVLGSKGGSQPTEVWLEAKKLIPGETGEVQESGRKRKI